MPAFLFVTVFACLLLIPNKDFSMDEKKCLDLMYQIIEVESDDEAGLILSDGIEDTTEDQLSRLLNAFRERISQQAHTHQREDLISYVHLISQIIENLHDKEKLKDSHKKVLILHLNQIVKVMLDILERDETNKIPTSILKIIDEKLNSQKLIRGLNYLTDYEEVRKPSFLIAKLKIIVSEHIFLRHIETASEESMIGIIQDIQGTKENRLREINHLINENKEWEAFEGLQSLSIQYILFVAPQVSPFASNETPEESFAMRSIDELYQTFRRFFDQFDNAYLKALEIQLWIELLLNLKGMKEDASTPHDILALVRINRLQQKLSRQLEQILPEPG